MAIELHKHVVPNFEVSSAIARRIAVIGTRSLIADDEHFGIGTARSGLARNPPVVLFRQEENVLFEYSALFPYFRAHLVARGVLVARKNGNGEFFHGYAEVFGRSQKFIAPFDCLFVKIIAERPVAEHFKKRAVRRVAYLVDIAGTNAFLNVGKTLARRVLFAEQVRH